MIKAHKIRLNPRAEQEAYFYRASGVARFAWNWALEEYKRHKAAGQKSIGMISRKSFGRRSRLNFPIDFGLSRFATLSNGDKSETQAHYRQAEGKLKRLQRGLARKQKGASNRKKWKLKIARAHERVSNLRNDFLHKFTSSMAKTFSIVCVEDLCLKGWIRLAGKSTHDAGIGQAINQLGYKTREAGGILQKVGRFFASSKRRHVCRYVNDDLQLSDRVWQCPNCGAEHERDENGAINIEMEGVNLLAGSGYIGVTPVEFAASALKHASM